MDVPATEHQSISQRAHELDLRPSTSWKILRKDLGLRAYKIQIVQELKPNDYQARHRFVEWVQNEIAVDFHKRILFSDEAHFWLNGYVNKQNYRIGIETDPQVYAETPLHPEKPTVWCALWAGEIIGYGQNSSLCGAFPAELRPNGPLFTRIVL